MKKQSKMVVMISIFLSVTMCLFNVLAAGSNDEYINYLTNDETQKIEEFIEKNMKKGNIPGLSVTIVKDDKTIYQRGFGYSDTDEKKQVSSETLFELSSNSKAFTALGILNLEQSGQINLQDEVNKYIPWLKFKHNGNETSVTIEQLLYQKSGIPFKTINNIPVSDADNALEETVKTLVGIELDTKPGERFQYATINYDVLGLVIEKVTGKSYEEYIEETVIKPMGLENTYLNKDQKVNELMSKGYKINFIKAKPYEAPVYRGNKPAGYIISSGEDMARWLKIQMGVIDDFNYNQEIIQRSKEINGEINTIGNGTYYNSGWFVSSEGQVFHGGNNPNYSSFITFDPEEKLGVAVLSNINSGYTENIGSGIAEILQGETVKINVSDQNKSTDIIAVIIICISVVLVLLTIYFMIKTIKETLKKQRHFKFKGVKSVIGLVFSFIFMLGVSYCIYIMPQILFGGLSWKFVFVWLPNSIATALYSVYITIWIVYIHFVFRSFFKKEKDKELGILSLLSVLSGFGNALIIFTINMAINSSNDQRIKLLIYFILGIFLYVYGQRIIRKNLVKFTNGIVYEKRMEIINKLLSTQYNKFEQIERGRIEATLNNDTETVSTFVNVLIGGVTSAITLICCFIYLATVNIYALLLAITIILFIASIYFIVGRYANRLGEEARNLQNTFFRFINDLIGGFKELSLNENRKNEFEKDMEKNCGEFREKRSKAALAFANMFVIGELLFTLAIGSVVFIFPFILKNLDMNGLTSYVFILLYMTGPVHGILNAIPNAIQVRISLRRINNMIDEISVSVEDKNKVIENVEEELLLELKDVEYEYANTEGHSFKVGPINLEFRTGEITFITGGNGSGKSTLAKLLTGLYMPTQGEITLNEKISQKLLNESYSTVFSDFYLFEKLYGLKYKENENEIQKHLEELQLSDKVQIEEGKFSTINLSTGQRKRLALLVTYLEDRPIYLFDEWAADQDPEFRLFFYDTLLPKLKADKKCVIAITHDDRYFNLADKVIKMEFGKILGGEYEAK